jgi:hypothetical protein
MKTNLLPAIDELSDHDLLARIERAAEDERHATAHLIALLMEFDSRKLYLREGFSSMFTFCTGALHCSEHAAYNRIEAARTARRFPILLQSIAEGAITLAAVRLLGPHLTPENHRDVLERARHRSKREVEQLVATLHPRPDVATAIRKLPSQAPRAVPATLTEERPRCDERDTSAGDASTQPQIEDTQVRDTSPSRRADIRPLAPERYKIQFTVGSETYEKLRRVQDLLRHSVPNGDPAMIFERALALLLKELERKIAASDHPRATCCADARSRHIPAAIKRAVWQRDNGQCAFKGHQKRCSETGFLEYHHVVPFALGGETSAANLELRCRAHNQYEADLDFARSPTPVMREESACVRHEGQLPRPTGSRQDVICPEP